MISSTEPTQIFAGDLAQWTIGPNESIQAGNGTQFDFLFSGPGIMRDYLVSGTGLMQDFAPSAGWALHYALKNKDQSFQFDASSNGDDYVVSVDSSEWAPGRYLLIGYVTKGDPVSERHVVRTSYIQVFVNPAQDGPVDFRTPARQIYEKILADEARGVYVADYVVAGRSCRYNSPTERRNALQFWAHRVAREEGKLRTFEGVTFSV